MRLASGLGVFLAIVTIVCASPWHEAEAQQGSCTVAADQEARRTTARENFVRGQELFEANDYNTALVTFECSFQNVPHPSTLYNIARAAELAGQFDRALDAWRGYLQMNPEAEDRAEIEERIRGLEQALASQNNATPTDPSMGGQPQQPVQSWTPSTPPQNAAAAPTDWTTPTDAPTNVYTPNMAPGTEYQAVEVRPASPWRRYAWYLFGGGVLLALVGVFIATPLLNLATDDDMTAENDGSCYDQAAADAGEYEISAGCYIAGAIIAGVGGAVMLASILVYALVERGGQYVVTRTAERFRPRLAVGQGPNGQGVGGTLSFSF